ncbi:hypothetical protein CAPTEDRAFT_214670 [Capitella teleta]|uniref:Uncharacterized protein n=1 Tax=Capitella teleta TaxID=283909 RepID=R7UGF8_CAPTE|nr:hypothetical protein CAPTEDRAFT_214670 [Capitella teleta]|eukprot:ELU05168.1 hypothetical protein CAPTEDRAFT_214670 [Capitella teleta]
MASNSPEKRPKSYRYCNAIKCSNRSARNVDSRTGEYVRFHRFPDPQKKRELDIKLLSVHHCSTVSLTHQGSPTELSVTECITLSTAWAPPAKKRKLMTPEAVSEASDNVHPMVELPPPPTPPPSLDMNKNFKEHDRMAQALTDLTALHSQYQAQSRKLNRLQERLEKKLKVELELQKEKERVKKEIIPLTILTINYFIPLTINYFLH